MAFVATIAENTKELEIGVSQMDLLINVLLPGLAIAVAFTLLQPGVRESAFWRAMVTPLASIIGSGFLIIAPLLGSVAGNRAIWPMLAIVSIAYILGMVLRFNIRYAEPLLGAKNHAALQFTERLSNIALSVAYVISVAFYVRLLAAFALRAIDTATDTSTNLLTSSILVLIGFIGWFGGLKGLERLEEWAVTLKLAVIVALLAGLAQFDVVHGFGAIVNHPPRGTLETLQMLAGMLLVVQGFETSRYLGDEYSADIRIRSMRFAQLVSAAIYIAFVGLITPLLPLLAPGVPGETAIVDLAGNIAVVLPAMLVFAAITSQFSAAIADTLGAGGLVTEESGQRIPAKLSYTLLVVCAITVIWTTDIFQIIAFASRAFAFYYLAQALVALQVSQELGTKQQRVLRQAGFGLVAAALTWVVIFAIPAA